MVDLPAELGNCTRTYIHSKRGVNMAYGKALQKLSAMMKFGSLND